MRIICDHIKPFRGYVIPSCTLINRLNRILMSLVPVKSTRLAAPISQFCSNFSPPARHLHSAHLLCLLAIYLQCIATNFPPITVSLTTFLVTMRVVWWATHPCPRAFSLPPSPSLSHSLNARFAHYPT